MRASHLAGSIAESATLRINERASQLKAEGKPVIHLGIGEPKNPAPPSARKAVEELLGSGMLKYAPAAGLPSLRESIAQVTSQTYQYPVAARNVIVSNGSKQALYNLLLAVVDPGDEVVFPAPYWVSYPEMVRLARGEPIAVPPISGSIQPDPDALLAAIGDRTRAVILNSPNNPSGQVVPDSLLAELVRSCEQRGIYLVMDDIYRQLVFSGAPPNPAYSHSEHPIESTHVIVLNGVSKLYGLTGVRVGWAIAPSPLVKAMAKLQGQSTSNASVLSQAAAEGALTGDQAGVAELLRHLAGNRVEMLDQLAGMEAVRIEPPEGGLYCFPDFSKVEPDSMQLGRLLLDRALVATVPGIEFGCEGYLRLGFAGTAHDVEEGMRRIRWAVDPAQPAELDVDGQRLVRDWV